MRAGEASAARAAATHRSRPVGLEGGYDLVHKGDHWLSIYGRVCGSLISSVGLGVAGLGVAYRH